MNKKLSSIDLGNEIRRLRKNKKLSQKDLAERIGTYSSHVGKMERGEIAPTHAYRLKLEKELGPLGTLIAPEKDGEGKTNKGGNEMDELISMTTIVLAEGQDSPYCRALTENIKSFFRAVAVEKKLASHPISSPEELKI